jgi:hypothetical protein
LICAIPIRQQFWHRQARFARSPSPNRLIPLAKTAVSMGSIEKASGFSRSHGDTEMHGTLIEDALTRIIYRET